MLVSRLFEAAQMAATFDLSKAARKNILELTPYRCARDVR